MLLQHQSTQHCCIVPQALHTLHLQLVCQATATLVSVFCSLHAKICSVNAGVGLQVGICAVGISSVLSGQGSASADVTQSQILLGMALIVCSQVPVCLYTCIVVLLTLCLGGFHWLIVAAAAVCVSHAVFAV